jgi:preprotein translocase subunit YajC
MRSNAQFAFKYKRGDRVQTMNGCSATVRKCKMKKVKINSKKEARMVVVNFDCDHPNKTWDMYESLLLPLTD